MVTIEFPGFIDLQVNGYQGVDFSGEALTEEDFIRASWGLIRQGTAGFLPTIITSPERIYARNLPIMMQGMRNGGLDQHILGFHIEGPFLSPQPGARGAHNPKWMKAPEIDFFKRMMDWSEGKIRMITIAAELPGAEEFCEYAAEQGVVVSLGHQLAKETDIERLRKARAKAFTHLGNGLPHTIDRHGNPIHAALVAGDMKVMFIPDGHHIPPMLIEIFKRCKPLSQLVAVSDASPAAGLPPGQYFFSGNPVELAPDGRLYNPETGYLVGSSYSMLECMRHLASLGIFDQQGLYQLCYSNPLALIGKAGEHIPSHRLISLTEDLVFHME